MHCKNCYWWKRVKAVIYQPLIEVTAIAVRFTQKRIIFVKIIEREIKLWKN